MACNVSLGELACFFPFLDKSAAYLSRRGLLLDAVLADGALVEKALERLRTSLERRLPNPRQCLDAPDATAAAARLALYIAAATKNPHVLRRFADSESKNFTALLRKVPGIQDPRCKIELARDLGVNARPAGEVAAGIIMAVYNSPVAVRWTSYLRYAPQDPYWAMINRPVVRGWVIVPMEDFERLLEESYEERILQIVRENELAVGKVAMSIDLTQLEDVIKRYSQRPVLQAGQATGGADPPCMEAILAALKKGENLPHTARFAITTYLIKRGWDVEQIVELFRASPDFNEKITRYQVMHIAGQAGGRKEYAVPSCETMNSWGLCPTNLRCGVKNPLQYGRRLAVKKSS
ncbi:DNA primase large subunit PriL [Pyrobaculum neutrophilum]|uniref:DNA primase large subunit PriL n=1 Tax=Pyrobaculum neutrophilum (strain DSM 2338 / JCM 9278 / NBRC 100436 / V24Sta) TaxID=444157 RepID=B1Y997_PYRNV|nr:DNA primase large subunit PriL [Pyrobaculum neutrophilum]ACB40326.1 DNA primase, large subunit [Pyrobaculum neutrophilum V24Sta]